MRIDQVHVTNFRGIRELSLSDLQNTIVIAGANGSGKSCVFDAIRLLKSAYGGYQQNEWHHWMAEFQVNFANNAEAFRTFFQDPGKRLSIKCVFRLHPDERKYLHEHGEELVRTSVWRLIAPEMYGWSSYNAAPMAAQYRDREPEVADLTKTQHAALMQELSQDTITGHLWSEPDGNIHFAPSKALEIIFSNFLPGQIGLIDYHGPQRMYTREQVVNVNLDLTATEQQNRQHALYNYSNKYGQVKTEMASSFIKELLSRQAGVPADSQNTLTNTLKELFSTFFPDKEFLGLSATPEGGLAFPVRTSTGAIHDLNELSAGEKEVLYGYLRIRNSAPRFSIILIDEPELHLNPRLIQGLPQFYHHHLGVALDNQIWLVTHSDTLLREVVGRPEYSVFHMVGASQDVSAPQIVPITMGEAAERALISLVGDIAAYRPGKKVVIFEGGGDSEFDAQFATRLFPELTAQANAISGGNKLRVRELHDILDAANRLGTIPFKVYSITDKDGETNNVSPPRYKWDVYHIENYLIEADFIRTVLLESGDISDSVSSSAIYDKLRMAASACLKSLVQHEITDLVNSTIRRSMDFGFDPMRSDVADAVNEAMQRSLQRIETVAQRELTVEHLRAKEAELNQKLQADLATDAWRATFRGRDILKEFAKTNCRLSYELLRSFTMARMGDAGFKPPGMAAIIRQILAA